MTVSLGKVYRRLLDHYGPQGWWPGESPFEVLVGAVLTQNTAWRNVERAIENLKAADVLSPRALAELDPQELAELIRPAGYYRLKTRRLLNVVRLVVDQHGGDLARMFARPLDVVRAELLEVNGVGPETADSILLYVGGLPSFVVDTYTHRIVTRHGWLEFEADYHQLQAFFAERLEPDPALFNEYHALLVRVGKEHCGKTPDCEGCPLAEWLPPGGPREP